MSVLHVVVPTLGRRQSLLMSLASLLPIRDTCLVEVRSPVDVAPDLLAPLKRFPNAKVTVADDGSQAAAITAGWRSSDSALVTWLNDDDFALPGAARFVDGTRAQSASGTVFFGDVLVTGERETKYVRTPRQLSARHLIYGRDYVPGVMTALDVSARKLITEHSTNSRDSFDYEWWLVLARAGCRFEHVGAATGAWLHSEEARTVADPEVGIRESRALRRMFGNELSGRQAQIASGLARAHAKWSSYSWRSYP